MLIYIILGESVKLCHKRLKKRFNATIHKRLLAVGKEVSSLTNVNKLCFYSSGTED